MLSLFPSLLAFQEISPFILRLTLGIIFIFWVYQKLQKKNTEKNDDGSNRNTGNAIFSGILEAIIGVLLITGLFVQLAAFVSALVFIIRIILKIRNRSFMTDGVNYYFILLVISLSLLVTGPGRFAFDLPL